VIPDHKCEECIHYLHDSDDEAAVAKVDVQKAEDEIKAREDAIFMRSEGSVESKKVLARSDPETVKARNEYYSVLLKFERLYNKRKTAERIIELWRSCNSNRRAGIQI
jgi:hypothetical protein